MAGKVSQIRAFGKMIKTTILNQKCSVKRLNSEELFSSQTKKIGTDLFQSSTPEIPPKDIKLKKTLYEKFCTVLEFFKHGHRPEKMITEEETLKEVENFLPEREVYNLTPYRGKKKSNNL